MDSKNLQEVHGMYQRLNAITKPVNTNIPYDLVNEIASLFSVGPFYYYIFNFETMMFEYVHPNVTKILGIQPDELSVELFFNLLHPDDQKIWAKKETVVGNFLLNKIKTEDIPKYKVMYLLRFKNTKNVYRTILYQAKALSISKDNKIQHVITIHSDITHLKPKFDHNFSVISNTLPSYYSIDTGLDYKLVESNFKGLFTKREKEIISNIAEGLSANEIASKLFLSLYTVNTHKRNILQKSNCKNTSELLTRCLREGVI
jgi:DNA-binding NarL/FixJ family response regulator